MMSSPETAVDRAATRPPGEALLGVIGLGHMGHAFAANLIADGASLTVYDRKGEVAAPLAASGAAVAENFADFAGCEIVLTSLPDHEVVRHVVLGAEGSPVCSAKVRSICP